MLVNNEDSKICSACGGQCCKFYPGLCVPDDFGPDESAIKSRVREKVSSGLYTIDWWEGDPTGKDEFPCVHFVRPSVKGKEFWVTHALWNGECTFFAPDGCSLPFDARPSMCKAVIPKEDFACTVIDGYQKKDIVLLWIPFQKILQEIIDELEED